MSTDLGRVAYDAYRLRRGGVAYDGTAIPEWDALRPEIREAWAAAASAAIGARSPQPAGTIDLDAARKTAREAQERAEKAEALQNAYEESDARGDEWEGVADAWALSAADVPNLAAPVLAMAEEIERLRVEVGKMQPVFDAALERHSVYFGRASTWATKHRATQNLNRVTFLAKGGE